MMAPAMDILQHRPLMSKISRLLSPHLAAFSTRRMYLHIKGAKSKLSREIKENLHLIHLYKN